MFIVTDEVLERLICSQCKKYLSVKPVRVYPNRGITCGRCSNPFDAGVTSLYGVLAEEALFRCINRFDGCNQLLNYSDVTNHEITCRGKKYECPICTNPFNGTAYDILTHFKEVHENRLLIGTSEFNLDLDNEQYRCYLYQKNDFLFFINSSYYKSSEEFILSVSYLGTDQEASKVSQMFSLLSFDGKIIHQTKRKPCSSVTGKTSQYFIISLSKCSFPKNIVVCKFMLNVEDIQKVLVLPGSFKKSNVEGKQDGINFSFKSLLKIQENPNNLEQNLLDETKPNYLDKNKDVTEKQEQKENKCKNNTKNQTCESNCENNQAKMEKNNIRISSQQNRKLQHGLYGGRKVVNARRYSSGK